jgi:cobalamin biosynthesis protein CobW
MDPSALLGLESAAESDLASRPSHHELEGEEHDHDDFETFALHLGEFPSRELLVERIGGVVKEHEILRLKGFAALEAAPSRLLVQAVGPRVDTYFDRPWAAGESRATSLVVIGLKGLNRQAITAALT